MSFNFAFVTDPQIGMNSPWGLNGPASDRSRLEWAINFINEPTNEIDFTIFGGDLVNNRDAEEELDLEDVELDLRLVRDEFGEGADHRERLGLPGKGPVGIITDLCVMEPEAGSNEFVVTSLHPGVTREQVIENTGWAIRFADNLSETAEPTETELEALRALEARTAAAHGQAGGDE